MEKTPLNLYKDRYSELVAEVTEALQKEEITESQAEIILGIIVNKKINKFVKGFIDHFGLNDELKSKGDNVMYIEYNRTLFQQ